MPETLENFNFSKEAKGIEDKLVITTSGRRETHHDQHSIGGREKP